MTESELKEIEERCERAIKGHSINVRFEKDALLLVAEVRRLLFLMKSIANNTVCIGVKKRHADGNCAHCTARWTNTMRDLEEFKNHLKTTVPKNVDNT